MTLILVEGFDHYNSQTFASLKGWNNVAAGNTTQYAQTGRINGESVKLTGGAGSAQTIRKVLAAGFTEVYAGVAVNPGALSGGAGDSIFLTLTTTTGTAVVQLGINAAGTISVTNSANTVIATGTAVVTVGAWFYAELHALMNGASGSVSTQINGVADVTATTTNIGSTGVAGVQLNSRNNTIPMSFDDIYLLNTSGSLNNSFLGDVHVETIQPSADGATLQWTPSTGLSHFSLVNENPPDNDSTYVFSSTVGNTDTYVFPSLSVLSGTVFGIQTDLYARKDNVATRQVKADIRSGGTDFQPGATQTLSASYQFFTDIVETDPNTSAQWTVAGVNNAQYGIKLVT